MKGHYTGSPGSRGTSALPSRPHPAPRVNMTTAKVIELVGGSPSSFEEAVQNAVAEAARSVKGISGVDVVGMNAKVEGDRLTEFRANVKIAFTVQR